MKILFLLPSVQSLNPCVNIMGHKEAVKLQSLTKYSNTKKVERIKKDWKSCQSEGWWGGGGGGVWDKDG